ncbi:Pentatricopeptide repeat-containing protein [Porphyridium purpureum]|uniref:Pentatricopeptide repeat-containing protein n=1 Tax=Porphyridium purpureum TaxID=35688 RepID=A0A5J4Z8C1_PORPP|nr:Pentatricopeptide repeat-containing protein [Porphyridium purpureum]|eukprot:POR8955..scf295_1
MEPAAFGLAFSGGAVLGSRSRTRAGLREPGARIARRARGIRTACLRPAQRSRPCAVSVSASADTDLQLQEFRNIRDVNRRISRFGRQRQLDEATRLFRTVTETDNGDQHAGLSTRFVPNVFTLNAYIDAVVRCRGKGSHAFEHIKQTLHELDALRIGPSPVTLNTTLKCARSLAEAQTIMDWFDSQFCGRVSRDVVTFNSLIHLAVLARDKRSVDSLVRQMSERGIVPNGVTYGTLMKSLVRKEDATKLLELLCEYQESCNDMQEVSFGTFATAIGTLVHIGRSDIACFLLDPLLPLEQDSFATLRAHIRSNAFCLVDEEVLERVHRFTKHWALSTPDLLPELANLWLRASNAQSKEFPRNDWLKLARALLNKSENGRDFWIHLDEWSLREYAAIEVRCGEATSPDNLVRFVDFARHEHAFGSSSVNAGIAVLCQETSYSMTDILACVRRLTAEFGVRLDPISFVILMDACSERQDSSLAEQIVRWLESEFCDTRALEKLPAYNALLKTYRSELRGELKKCPEGNDRSLDMRLKAENVLEKLVRSGTADTVTFNTYLDLVAEDGDLVAALQAIDSMTYCKVSLTSGTMNAMLKCIVKSDGNLEDALKLIREFSKDFQVRCDAVSYTFLISLCMKPRNTYRAEKFFAALESVCAKTDQRIHVNSYVALMRVHVKSDTEDHLNRAIQIFEDASNSLPCLSKNILLVAADAYSRLGRSRDVVCIFQRLRTELNEQGEDIEMMERSYVLKALCRGGHHDSAWRMLHSLHEGSQSHPLYVPTSSWNMILFECMHSKKHALLVEILRYIDERDVARDDVTNLVMAKMLRTIAGTLRSFDAALMDKLKRVVTSKI